MPKTTTNNITIDYEITGDGPPLVLIAGLGYPKWMWHKMLPGLAAHFRVITFDNRGVGESDKPAGPYTAQMLAADTVGLMDALGIEKAHVMGHSMGGFIAQALVLDTPDRVDRLILSATNFGGPRHIPVTPEAMAVLTDTSTPPLERLRNGILISCTPGFGDAHPEIVEEWLTWRATHPLDLAGYQAQMSIGLGLMSEAAAFEHKLPAVQHETLILFGADDKVVPPGNADLLAAQLPNSTVAILPHAGHFFPFDATDAAVAAVVSFLVG